MNDSSYRRHLQVVLDKATSTLQATLPCCPNCEHFRHEDETCKLTQPPARPPAKVVAFGCPAFSQDIPF